MSQPETTPPDPLLTGEHLRRAAVRDPGKVAIVMGDRRISFAELDRQADRVANALIAAGIGKGARIAVLSPTVADYPAIFYGAARSGCVCLNLSVRLTADDVARMITLADLRLIFVGPGMLDTARAAAATAGRPVTTVPDVPVTADDPYIMILSGGTTGTPKLILLNHRATSLWAIAATQDFDLTRDDIYAVPVPLFHGAGLLIWLAAALMQGGTCILMPGWDRDMFTRLVPQHGITAAILVPTQLSDLIHAPDFDPAAFAGLRKINHAGMKMPVALLEQAVAALPHAAFTDNFGTSETGPLTARPHWSLPDMAHSVGRPLFLVELDVMGPDGQILPRGETGEIVTRGPQVMIGYFGDPEGTEEIKRPGGWRTTGDVGFFEPNGFLVLVDRARDVIISGGENIYPNEIENALYQHPAVAEAAVFAIPDDHWGELPAAQVVIKTGQTATAETLISHVATQIPRHKRPRLIDFVDELPKTGVGKIQKNLIRAPYWGGADPGTQSRK
jgi:acyl-CoA synthetase (AMP-forming)/AMP-acid ligase II